MAELKNIRIAVSGIYDYAYEELPSLQLPLPCQGAPEWVEKKRVYKVYRPALVLAAACDKFKMLPLTHHHPNEAVDEQNFQKLIIGYTGSEPFVDYLENRNEVGICSTVMLGDKEALDAYNRGEVQLSPGYYADFEWSKGTSPDGQEYDIIMKKINDVNHLALLPCGRGGSDAVVLDNAPKTKELSIFEIVKQTKDGAETLDARRIYKIGEISEKTGLQKTANGWRPVKKSTENNKKNDAGKIEKDYKKAQLEVILKTNKMNDDYHVGIRTVDDIKTFEEAMQDDESFYWGDFEREDAEKALKEGSITVYSSKPIAQGGFVSTSMNQAKDYAGGGKIYTKEIPLKEVAWINGDEGQYTGNLDTEDGAPIGNDNASKNHENKDKTNVNKEVEERTENIIKKLQADIIDFPEVEFNETNYKKYLGTPIETPLGKVKMGEHQFEKLKTNRRTHLIGAIAETLKKPGYMCRDTDGKIIFIKTFKRKENPHNVVTVLIERDGLKITISAHDKRDNQIRDIITRADPIKEVSPDHGTVHDCVADTTCVASLIIQDEEHKIKSIFEIVKEK
jgi:hypothetical protein